MNTGHRPGASGADPDDRPLLQLLRSDCIIKLYRDGDGAQPQSVQTMHKLDPAPQTHYTLRVARLRGGRTTLENLTAAEALDRLAEEMRGDG